MLEFLKHSISSTWPLLVFTIECSLGRASWD